MMNHFAPHYINEHQSDMRGIKDGWYVMEEDGNLVSGPFSSREDCVRSNTRSEGIVTSAECNQLANVTSPAAASSSR
jgi:putative methionine-R-sulfoxide reductase with GAF domain